MMRISRPLNAGQVKAYHATEFTKAGYYSQDATVIGEWHGRLANAWGLVGGVPDVQFARLADGQDPHTGRQLIRHLAAHERTQPDGTTKTTAAHRAGWDLTFSAPKGVSLTALIGGDERVRQAHREAVNHALRATETYTQARVGSGQPSETTGRWVSAKFEHDSSRPVGGYAAPQLHTHVVVFNMTEMADGRMRSLQPLEIYKTIKYATAVYRSELTTRLHTLGYQVDRGEHHEPVIRGYSQAYLDASSPRSQQAKAHLEQHGGSGQRATELAVLKTRSSKDEAVSPEEMVKRHEAIAAQFGHQAAAVVALARNQQTPGLRVHDQGTAERAMDYAINRNMERNAAPHEREFLRDALIRSMGDTTSASVHQAFRERISSGRLIERPQPPGRAGHAYTTPDMQRLERDVIQTMLGGRGQFQPLVPTADRAQAMKDVSHLSADKQQAFAAITASHDLVYVLDGRAGAGKTVALAVVKTAAERGGYQVEGLAPTGKAALKLHAESGMPTQTLQRHLQQPPEPSGRHLYVLDESSLASTTQLHTFLHRLGREDRVLLVGDTRQHQAVDAGRPFDQLQEAGVAMSTLTEIHRQKANPELLAVVERLADGRTRDALHALDAQGRIHAIPSQQDRLNAVAQTYVEKSAQTLVISPDNAAREQLNAGIRQALRDVGRGLKGKDEQIRVLVPRSDLTGPDRAWAGRYAVDDVLRYSKSSKLGVTTGEYARVTHADPQTNDLTVQRADGSTLTYNARRLQGVSVYRDTERPFAVGDRVQFTAPVSRVANRELGTVKAITPDTVKVKLDDGRVVRMSRDEAIHLEHGYATTSYSSQCLTVDRMLLYINPDRAGAPLVNQRMIYVAVSRARSEVQIFCEDKPSAYRALGREYTKETAIDVPQQAQKVTHSAGIGHGW